jgi:serine protease SohB
LWKSERLECFNLNLIAETNKTVYTLKDKQVEFLFSYLEFLAKTVTVAVAVVVVFGGLSAIRQKNRQSAGQLRVRKLNDFFLKLQRQLQLAVLDKTQVKKFDKERVRTQKLHKLNSSARPRVFVLDFDGDIKASATDSLRNEITALLNTATKKDEVLLRLESGGGMVNSYGLAASQLVRIRQGGIPLTVCIDKIAASGGYMMACIGNKVISSPFAVLGSIGVVAQLPNLNRLLKKYDVDFELLTSGEYKRTLTVFGENTVKGRDKLQKDLEVTHELFKNFVATYRPKLDINKVATGEVWLGINALENMLVDELKTSDEYLVSRAKDADLFHLQYVNKRTFRERAGMAIGASLDRLLFNWISRMTQQRF